MFAAVVSRGVRGGALRPRPMSVQMPVKGQRGCEVLALGRGFSTKPTSTQNDNSNEESQDEPKVEKKKGMFAGMFARVDETMELATKWLHGPLGEANDSARLGTKVVETAREIVPADKAAQLPALDLTTLSNTPVKVPNPAAITILLVGFNQLGMQQVGWHQERTHMYIYRQSI
jgi:hypothetical protein